ncbi:CMP-N-acetylneuraminate-poly-alpha-2,8-sialyltransferase-like [Glandiceps talaboti]
MTRRNRQVWCCYVSIILSISLLGVFYPYTLISKKQKVQRSFDQSVEKKSLNNGVPIHATSGSELICTDTKCGNQTSLLIRFKKSLSSLAESENLIRVYERQIGSGVYEFYQEFPLSRNISMNSVPRSETYSLPLQKSCAVVGNGGILRNSKCGEHINNHDFVFRFNVADIESHIRDVGLRTNITVINKLICVRMYDSMTKGNKNFFPGEVTKKDALHRMRHLNDTIVWYPESMSDVRCTRPMLQYVVHNLQTKFRLPFRMGYTGYGNLSNLTKRFLKLEGLPTVGIRTVLTALLLCDDVTVYGFYPFPTDSRGKMVPHHYYGAWSHKVNKYEKSVHGWDEEFASLQSLHKMGVIRLVTSKCA